MHKTLVALAFTSFIGCSSNNTNTTPTPDAFVPHVDAPINTGPHLTTYNWGFSDIAFNVAGNDTVETATGCPGGTFDTAAVISQQASSTGVPVGTCAASSTTGVTCYVDLYDCTALTGTETLPEAYYLQWIAITNHAGTQLYADTASALIDETMDNTVTADILNDGGYFQFDWALKNASNASITCADLANDGISLDSTVANSTNGLSDAFDCVDGTGITSGLPAGSYALSASILNAQQQALGTTDVVGNKTIAVQNAITDLGTITIKLN